MRRFAAPIVLALFFLAFACVIVWMMYLDTGQPEKKAAQISVVVYGENNDRWRSLDQGISQACRELGIEKPVLTVVRGADPERQAILLQREVDNGARGLLVAAMNSAALDEYLTTLTSAVPVVTVESGAGTLPFAGVDDAAMGRALADRVAEQPGSIALLAEGLVRDNISRRYEAFLDRMRERGREVTVFQREEPRLELKAFIASGLATSKPSVDCLVALDNNTLESAIDAVPAAMVEVTLCGIGSSDKVLHALDTGLVSELAFPNEYAVGYIGTRMLAAEMGLAKAPDPADIQFSLVNRENLYEPEIERLLFPIIQ